MPRTCRYSIEKSSADAFRIDELSKERLQDLIMKKSGLKYALNVMTLTKLFI